MALSDVVYSTAMRTVFLEPIGYKTAWISVFEDSKLLEERFINPEQEKLPISDEILCFDAFKIFKYIEKSTFCKDVKVFYELFGHKFEGFMELARNVLGVDNIYEYIQLSQKVNAYIRSFKVTNFKISKYSVMELIPKDLLLCLYREKTKILMSLYEKTQDSELQAFYTKFFPSMQTLYELGTRPIYVDLDFLNKGKNNFFDVMKKNLHNDALILNFHPVGAKTGRISFAKGSTNLYILPTELRRVLVAPPDYKIIQADFKSFQPRIAIFSVADVAFKQQFEDIEDIYSVFPGDREENKISFISWMFSKQRNKKFEEYAGQIKLLKSEVSELAAREGKVINSFGRPLYYHGEEPHVVFQNYITSIEADAILSLTVYLNEFLKDKRSRLIFPFHDSLVFYVHKDEQDIVDAIKDKMENYHRPIFGSRLPVTIKSGQNFLEIS